jgi:hypothetical protein
VDVITNHIAIFEFGLRCFGGKRFTAELKPSPEGLLFGIVSDGTDSKDLAISVPDIDRLLSIDDFSRKQGWM